MPPRIPYFTRREQEEAITERFERRPSSAFIQVVQSIQKLARVEGWHIAERAIASGIGLHYLTSYEEQYDVRQAKSRGSGGLARLVGTDIDRGLQFPSQDHSDLWIRDNHVVRASEQPHGPIDDTQLRAMLAFCKKHALRMRISARSYHFAGRTLLIDLVREDGEPMP